MLAKIAKALLRFFYFFLKWARTDDKAVLFLSRQQNEPSLDFRLLAEELKRQDPQIAVTMRCRMMGEGGMALLKDFFPLLGQMRLLAKSRVCVLEGYCIPASILRHKKSLRILQIWHAMGAVKQFGYQTLDRPGGRSSAMAREMCMHRGYDAAVIGSAAMAPYFAQAFDMPQEKLLPLGMPRVDYLLAHEGELRAKILAAHPELKAGGGRVLLYAPTFRREKDEKLPEALPRALDLSRDRLIVKAHPLRPVTVEGEGICRVDDFTALELLTVADAVITDYSAIAIEAAALLKELYLYLYDYEEYARTNGLNIDLFAELPGCAHREAEAVAAAVAARACTPQIIRAFREKYVAAGAEHATREIASLIRGWLRKEAT